MADMVPAVRRIHYLPGNRFRGAVSEFFAQRLAGAQNFINLYQHSEKQFFLNGRYNIAGTPQLGVDGLVVFEFNAEIINAWMFNLVAGSGGTTELDAKIATVSGGAFSSIFTTTPKITSAAGANIWAGKDSGAQTGVTNPVLATTEIVAGTAMRFDLLQAQTGNPENCGLLIHYRPR
jgi:hypothetical protein